MIAPVHRHPWTHAISVALLLGCGPPLPRNPEVAPNDPIEEVSGEDLYQAGIRHAQAGDLLRAEQYLASSMHRGHDQQASLRALVRVCVASSRLRAALRYADPYLRQHPTDWALRYLVATIHLGLGEPAVARGHLTRVIELAPDEPDAHFVMGELLRDEDADISGAGVSFRRYLALAPDGERSAEATEALRRMNVPMETSGTEHPSAAFDTADRPMPAQAPPPGPSTETEGAP